MISTELQKTEQYLPYWDEKMVPSRTSSRNLPGHAQVHDLLYHLQNYADNKFEHKARVWICLLILFYSQKGQITLFSYSVKTFLLIMRHKYGSKWKSSIQMKIELRIHYTKLYQGKSKDIHLDFGGVLSSRQFLKHPNTATETAFKNKALDCCCHEMDRKQISNGIETRNLILQHFLQNPNEIKFK